MGNHKEKLWHRLPVLDWFYPGLGIKRWVVLLLLGVTGLGLGLSLTLVEIYEGGYLPPLLDTLTMQFLPRYTRAIVLGVTGTMAIIYALLRLTQEVIAPLVPAGRSVATLVAQRRRRFRGPRMVVIGGGTGMASLLRGIKSHT